MSNASPDTLFRFALVNLIWVFASLIGCSREAHQQGPKSVICPEERPAPAVLPGIEPEYRSWRFWAAQYGDEADTPLLTPRDASAQRAAVTRIKNKVGRPVGRWNVTTRRMTPDRLKSHLQGNAAAFANLIGQKRRVLVDGATPDKLLGRYRRLAAGAHLVTPADYRLVAKETSLRTLPGAMGLYGKAGDLRFDLNRCSQVFPGEIVRVLYKADARWWLVLTSYVQGWVDPRTLSAALPQSLAERFAEVQGPVPTSSMRILRRKAMTFERDGVALEDATGTVVGFGRVGLVLPLAAAPDAPQGPIEDHYSTVDGPRATDWAWFASAVGALRVRSSSVADISVVVAPLTRRALFRRAFSLLGQPYGWGGNAGNRDCSRLMMDIFAGFDVFLPRNSSRQSIAGVENIDVGSFDRTQKRRAIRKAALRGALLLYMPGHVALYLGSDGAFDKSRDFAIHSLFGYATPCKAGGETLNLVNRVAVTSLDLGTGSSRKSYLDRIQTLVVIGRSARGEGRP